MNNAPQPTTPQTPKPERGSRACCLTFTDGTGAQVATRLTALVAPYGHVDPLRHTWMPKGPNQSAEAKLGEYPAFLNAQQRAIVTDWWLSVPRGANTPNWDIVSQATIGGQEGLILVEAKGHEHELSASGKPLDANASPNSKLNHQRIGDAISGANTALNVTVPGWHLSRDSHYQLSNRFAWSWKIASLGVPVILVYLGCIEVTDMRDGTKLLSSDAHWNSLVLAYAKGIVPDVAWQQDLLIPSGTATQPNTTPLRALIRSL